MDMSMRRKGVVEDYESMNIVLVTVLWMLDMTQSWSLGISYFKLLAVVLVDAIAELIDVALFLSWSCEVF